jgi:hypothetical protein
MHLDLKYQSPNTFGSKDIAQVKSFFFKIRSKIKVQVLIPKEGSLHNASISQTCIKAQTHLVKKI